MQHHSLARLSVLIAAWIACSARADEPPPPTTTPIAGAQVHEALTKAARFLIDNQSADGAWRSHRYGFLKDGLSLTPHVALSVQRLPDARATASVERAKSYLNNLLDERNQLKPDIDLIYPTYTVAEACRLANGDAATAWLAMLRRQQLTEALEWRPEDIEYGG